MKENSSGSYKVICSVLFFLT